MDRKEIKQEIKKTAGLIKQLMKHPSDMFAMLEAQKKINKFIYLIQKEEKEKEVKSK